MPYQRDTVAADAPPGLALQKLYDYDVGGNLIYEGWAPCGIATAAAAWAIRKNTMSGSNLAATQWADGNTNMDNVWDNRATTVVYA